MHQRRYIIGHLYTNYRSIHRPQEGIQRTRKKSIHSRFSIKVNQIKLLFRRFCSLLNQHTLDSMIIQVMSQEIHIVDSLCNSVLWLDTALLVNVHGYCLHNHQLLLSPSNCLISHTFIEVFLFLMSKMSNTLFARC